MKKLEKEGFAWSEKLFLFSSDFFFFNVIIISTKGGAICQNSAPFFDYTERFNTRFPFGFFILLE